MLITVVWSPGPRQVHEESIDLPPGSTVRDALLACASALPQNLPPSDWQLGIWGRRCELTALLREGDRLEIYRGLRVDPKLARRERFKGQGVRRAGLFAKRRPGAKPGY